MKIRWARYSWRSDAVFDLWSLIHTSWGVVAGMLFALYLPLDFFIAFLLALSIMIMWEVFEYLTGLGETRKNVVSDIVVAVFGFLMGYLYLAWTADYELILAILLLGVVSMEFLGWVKFFKKKK